MKIASAEALWNSQQPASFSLFQIGGCTQSDQNPSVDVEVPKLLSFLATGNGNAKVDGLNQVQAQETQKSGPGNYIPTLNGSVATTYWAMRVMAYLGTFMFAILAVGASLYRRRSLERHRWFLKLGVVNIAFPFLAAAAGWVLSEVGRQPWIVNGLLKTSAANSPSVGSGTIWLSLSLILLGYVTLTVVDFILMRRYARLDPPEAPSEEEREGPLPALAATDDGGGGQVSLAVVWFLLIAILWGGYFMLEGFDFGVGLLLPFLPRNEGGPPGDVRVRSVRSGTGTRSGSWTAGGATFAAFPAWYGTMFSGFYIALVLVLAFLIIKVLSFEWRSKSESPRWRTIWQWANTIGSAGASLIWGVAFANLLRGVPIDGSGNYSGSFWDLFSPYTVFAGVVVVLLFAFHGATYLTLQTGASSASGRPEPLTRWPCRSQWAASPSSPGRSPSPSTTTSAAPSDRPCPRTSRPPRWAGRSFRLQGPQWPGIHRYRRRHGRSDRDDLHQPLSARDGFLDRLRQQPDGLQLVLIALCAEVMTIVAVIFVPLVLLYQSWTYHVFRARVGGEKPSGPIEELSPSSPNRPPG